MKNKKPSSDKARRLRLIGIILIIAAVIFFRCYGGNGPDDPHISSESEIQVVTTEPTKATETTKAPETEPPETTKAEKTTEAPTTEAEKTTEAPTTKAEKTTEATTKAEKTTEAPTTKAEKTTEAGITVEEGESYTDLDHVALYIKEFGELPDNFITKKEAQNLGWTGGSLKPYAKGKSIGGSNFGNNEGLLPTKKGRRYFECDIDYNGGKRNGKRLVYSNDGLFFYTDDHYESFTQIYP